MSILRLWALCMMAVPLCSSPAWAEFAWRVESAAEIKRILPGAVAGDVFELAPGNWGPLSLRGITMQDGSPLVLRAQDPLTPPVLDSLDLRDVANIRIEGLAISLPDGGLAVDLNGARNVVLEGLSISGRGKGDAFDVTGSENIEITGASLTRIGSGLIGVDPQHLTLTSSSMTALTGQAISLKGGRWLTFDSNRLTGFDAQLQHPHLRIPDMVRLANSDVAPSHVLLKDNVIDSGAGPARPAVLIGDVFEHAPDTGPMRDITVSGNVIVTASRDGLVLGPVQGARIDGTAVLRTRQGPHRNSDPLQTTPQLRVSARSREVILRDNWAGQLPNAVGLKGWDLRDNFIVQDRRPGQAGHYDTVFVDPGHPDVLRAFQPKPGTGLSRAGSGPALLRQTLPAASEVALTSVIAEQPQRTLLTYAPEQGKILVFDTQGAPYRHVEVDRGSLPIGGIFPVWEVHRDLIAPIFDSHDFTLKLRLRGREGYRTGGEVLRVHNWMVLNIDNGGGLTLHFRSTESDWKQLHLRNAGIKGPDWHDIEIRFDTRSPDGVLSLHHGETNMADVAIDGRTLPLEHWNLALGNPFGDRNTWEGEIGGLTLTRRSMP